MDPWRLGSFLILIVLKSEVNGTLEPFTPETLCCQVLHEGKEMTDGQKPLVNEQMDCRQSWFGPRVSAGPDGCCGFDGFGGYDGFDGGDGS